jgi:hypothetical protein
VHFLNLLATKVFLLAGPAPEKEKTNSRASLIFGAGKIFKKRRRIKDAHYLIMHQKSPAF